jgi:hypothetical protein
VSFVIGPGGENKPEIFLILQLSSNLILILVPQSASPSPNC